MNSVFSDVVRCLVAGPEERDGSWYAAFVFPESFTGFDGHFPETPLLPGIAQIYAAQIVAGGGALAEIKKCKFMRPVVPGERMEVTLTKVPGEGLTYCKAAITANGEGCASVTFSVAVNAG